MRRIALVALVSMSSCAATPAARPLSLRRIVLYQNGIGHFEHRGPWHGSRFRLWVKQFEVDDVIKTLTVIDRGRGKGKTVAAVLPDAAAQSGDRVAIDVVLSGGPDHDLSVSYAVPTPTWKATYRVALEEEGEGEGGGALLQAWAMVDNVTPDTWTDVALTLATGAPMSFASDLRTPRFVSRPDASGRMVAPTATAPVYSERARPGDNDGDGIADVADTCPDAPEDRDQWEDDDGCPDADNDHDAIPDVDDKCPSELEIYNGYDDLDGCPDRGRVVISSDEIRVTEKIFFDRNSDALPAQAAPILDAVASVLRGNPQLTALVLEGHATPDEEDPWGLAARRGASVRAALVARGVSIPLDVVPYGDTQPVTSQAGETEQARAPNRRVELRVAERDGVEITRPAAPTARALKESVHSSALPTTAAGAVRYELADTVTLPAGASTLVSIINRNVGGEDVFLFRPDAAVPGSDRHPLRAARLVNESGLALEPGPVAVFARGAFVGEGLLERLPRGETAFIPYALEESTWVRSETTGAEEAGRLVSIARGVFTVENRELRRTRYEIAAGTDPTRRIFIKHVRAAGFTPGKLPPGAVETGDGWLIPIPLTDGKVSTLTVEERRPVRREVRLLLDRDDTTLSLALTGSELPAELKDKVAAALELRRKAGALEEQIEGLRDRLGDTAVRATELRATLKSVEKTSGAGDLRKRLLERLGEVLADEDRDSRELAGKTVDLADARSQLSEAVSRLSLE
jgi:outer membrane protein OmpA-like peptidoglycan-associated protein